MSRATTAEGVLETIYALAGVDAAAAKTATTSSAAIRWRCRPSGAAAVFYGIWPALVVAGGAFHAEEAGMKTIRCSGAALAAAAGGDRAARARPTSRSI